MSFNEILALITALPVGGSIVYAAIRLGQVAGGAEERLKSLTVGVEALTRSLQAFADKADERLTSHGERLAALEAARRSSNFVERYNHDD